MDNLEYNLIVGLLVFIGGNLWYIRQHMQRNDLPNDLEKDVKRQNIYLEQLLFQLRSQDASISDEKNDNYRYALETKLGCLDYLSEDVDEYLDQRAEDRAEYLKDREQLLRKSS